MCRIYSGFDEYNVGDLIGHIPGFSDGNNGSSLGGFNNDKSLTYKPFSRCEQWQRNNIVDHNEFIDELFIPFKFAYIFPTAAHNPLRKRIKYELLSRFYLYYIIYLFLYMCIC